MLDSATKEADIDKERKIKNIGKFLVPIFYFGAFYIAIKSLKLPPDVVSALKIIFMIIATWLVIRLIIAVLGIFIEKYIEITAKDSEKPKLRALTSLINALVWVIGFLFLIDNLGFNISTFIAGLGIGGIAVALAAQAILGDLFSYFVIFFDKPFEIGDFIIFDDKLGVIEKIGIKSTKIRALSGEILVVSNSNLTGSRVHNYKQMKRRRVVFRFGVVYSTNLEKLKQIPEMVKGIIENINEATFDRSNFFSYGSSSLDFETVYFIASPDYNLYMNIQEKINLEIMEKFNSSGIEFAYPTQTIHLAKSDRIETDMAT
jgi:small-conductance mechanosensitive channel